VKFRRPLGRSPAGISSNLGIVCHSDSQIETCSGGRNRQGERPADKSDGAATLIMMNESDRAAVACFVRAELIAPRGTNTSHKRYYQLRHIIHSITAQLSGYYVITVLLWPIISLLARETWMRPPYTIQLSTRASNSCN